MIAVKVNNAHNADVAPLSADFTFFGGIYRNVSLHVVGMLSANLIEVSGSCNGVTYTDSVTWTRA